MRTSSCSGVWPESVGSAPASGEVSSKANRKASAALVRRHHLCCCFDWPIVALSNDLDGAAGRDGLASAFDDPGLGRLAEYVAGEAVADAHRFSTGGDELECCKPHPASAAVVGF